MERLCGCWTKNKGILPPKWVVYCMENPMNKWMIWGYHYFWKHPYIWPNYNISPTSLPCHVNDSMTAGNCRPMITSKSETNNWDIEVSPAKQIKIWIHYTPCWRSACHHLWKKRFDHFARSSWLQKSESNSSRQIVPSCTCPFGSGNAIPVDEI